MSGTHHDMITWSMLLRKVPAIVRALPRVVRGMRWAYDPAKQTLSLTLTDALREQRVLSARTVRQAEAFMAEHAAAVHRHPVVRDALRAGAGPRPHRRRRGGP